MAEDEPETVQGLLRKEIANNWIVETSFSIADAREKLPLGIAVGKLNVVFAEGKEPRLVLDSTVCQVNTRCHLPERHRLQVPSSAPALTLKPRANKCRSARRNMAFFSSPFKGRSTTTGCAILGAVSPGLVRLGDQLLSRHHSAHVLKTGQAGRLDQIRAGKKHLSSASAC